MKMRSFPPQLVIGLGLIAVGWPLAWSKPAALRFFYENSFFLLWSGYALSVDGLVFARQGHSLLSRNRTAFLLLFLISSPCWWLFEFLNQYLNNWHYVLNRPVSRFEYIIRCSLHFSTVIPAVFGTAELWASSRILSRCRQFRALALSPAGITNLILLGILFLVLVITYPQYFFPLVWVCLFLVFDGVNALRGAPSLLDRIRQGDWRLPLALALGALTCGFFWEMWNYYSSPKWVYTLPYFEVAPLFEMPALGYLGYLPFGLELYSLYVLILELTGRRGTAWYGAPQG